VDAVIVHLFAGFGIWFLDMKGILSRISGHRKPILFWLIGPEKGREPTRMALEGEGWPTFHEIHRTVRVAVSLFDESKRKSRRAEAPPPHLSIPQSLKERIREANAQGKRILDEHEAKKWLKALGLNVVKEVVAKDLEEAIRAADRIGYPVVLKGRVEGRIHKTEAGLVKSNLWTREQLRTAYEAMSRLKPAPASFLIQPMLKGDLELIVGATRDPQFGPAVMLGLGGIHAEVYRDVSFRLPPLTEEAVLEMVSELKGKALLEGYRGAKPVRMRNLSDWLIKLGWLAMTFDILCEIDVNPLLVVEGEPVAVDATVILERQGKK
jgi:acetyltransferase